MTAGDNSIEYVNPYSLSQTINSDLISILDPNGSTTSIIKPQLNYQIPIFKSIDVSNLIDLNNTKIKLKQMKLELIKLKIPVMTTKTIPCQKIMTLTGRTLLEELMILLKILNYMYL